MKRKTFSRPADILLLLSASLNNYNQDMKRYSLLMAAFMLLIGLNVSAQKSPTTKIACVGNSITYGSGIKNRDSFSYPVQLNHMLGDHFEVRNFGVSGRTLLKKGDHPYWKEDAFRQVQAWAPDVIVIMLGTNDTKPWNWKYGDQFESDYQDLLETFKNLPSHPKIWAALPVPVFGANKYSIRDSVIKVEIPMIKRAARREKVHLLNLYKALKPYGKYFPDNVHPDKDGAYYLAKAVYQKVRK